MIVISESAARRLVTPVDGIDAVSPLSSMWLCAMRQISRLFWNACCRAPTSMASSRWFKVTDQTIAKEFVNGLIKISHISNTPAADRPPEGWRYEPNFPWHT